MNYSILVCHSFLLPDSALLCINDKSLDDDGLGYTCLRDGLHYFFFYYLCPIMELTTFR